MPDQAAIDLIAQSLAGGLVHPGDDKTPAFGLPALPAYQMAKFPPDMAEHFAAEAGLPHVDFAKLSAEALVHTLESAGKDIVDRAELARLRALDAAAEPRRNRHLQFYCRCGAMLWGGNVANLDTDKPTVFGAQVIKAMQQLHPECALGHRQPDGEA